MPNPDAPPTVPFIDLWPTHRDIRSAILADLGDLITRGSFTGGSEVSQFEQAFASYCNARSCVGVSSGLDALRLSLLAAGVGPGDEVIVPAQTFIATFEAVTQVGAKPVPVDVSPTDYNIDPAAADAAVRPRTRAIVPVHLYGQLADMTRVASVASRRDLIIVEDSCQAHGAERDGVSPGAEGSLAAFSFYPAKNLGAFGDAGAVITSDPDKAEAVRKLRDHGRRSKHDHDRVGYTARLDTIQAIVLLHKLPLLPLHNQSRSDAAAYYIHALDGIGDIQTLPVPSGSRPVWHIFVIHTEYRGPLLEHLTNAGIGVGEHYPVPPHMSGAYANLALPAGSFPVAEDLARHLLSLPLYPEIPESHLEFVVSTIRSFFDG